MRRDSIPGTQHLGGEPPALSDVMRWIPPGSHLSGLHESEEERLRAATAFLHAGLLKGEQCLYLADEAVLDLLIADLARTGIDVERERRSGALILKTERQTYTASTSGRFEPEEMLRLVERISAESLADGYPGMRGAADMAWALEPGVRPELLLEYEARLNERIPTNYIAFCQYDVRNFPPAILRTVLRTHPVAILDDLLCPNIYYEPPHLLLNGHGETARVEWMMRQLRAARLAEAEQVGFAAQQAAHAEAERERARLYQLFADAPAAIIVTRGADHRIELTNAVLADIFGGRDLVGKTVREAIPEAEAGGFVELMDRAYRNSQIEHGRGLPLEVSRADGEKETGYWDFVYQPWQEAGQLAGILGMGIDVSDRVLASKRLRQANRRKTEFLAVLGHELRNPLAAITNVITLVQERYPVAGPEQERMYAIAGRQSQHLSRLIDDLLDVARIEAGKVRLVRSRVDVCLIVSTVIDAARTAGKTDQHDLSVELPGRAVIVDGDAQRLEQAVANLLDNALKFTPQGGRIDVRVAAEGGRAVIEVADDGPGIARERAAGLFELFSQVGDTGARTNGGLGVGLALVRAIVEQHGGSVSADSPGPEQGSTFAVQLPLVAGPADAEDRVERQPQAEVVGVLLVEDQADVRESLALLLLSSGYEVTAVSDGDEALAAYEPGTHRLVLIDIGLPGMTGYEVVKRLRETPAAAASVFVALTGLGRDEDRQAALDAGFDHHVTKPLSVGLLAQLVGPD
jgi:PAS domain S-box-containing protein